MSLAFSYPDVECGEKKEAMEEKNRGMRLGQDQREGLWFVRLSTTGLLSDSHRDYLVGYPTEYAHCAATLCKWELDMENSNPPRALARQRSAGTYLVSN